MNRLVTTQEILIILSPAIGFAILALITAVVLNAWERRNGRR